MVIKEIEPLNVNGDNYFSLSQFAYLVDRSEASIRHLISKGNKIRKLKVCYFNKVPLIPEKELFDFPFLLRGRNPKDSQGTISKYFLKDGRLLKREETYEKCQ